MKSKKLFEFECFEHGRFEALAYENTDVKQCPECSIDCHSVISPTRFWLDGTDPAFPTAWDHWAKQHEEKAKKANQNTALEE